MAYLIDPAKAALAIGAKCGGSVSSDNEAMLSVLNLLLPRIEDAMNVGALTYGESTDTFIFEQPARGLLGSTYKTGANGEILEKKRLRLTNGYVDSTQIVVTDPNDAAVTDYRLDPVFGIVELPSWLPGDYAVVYKAGFKLPNPLPSEPDPAILVGVPAWLEGVAVSLLMLWYRTELLTPKAPTGFSFGELIEPLHREVRTRIYGRYDRPRYGVVFPDYTARTVA